MEKLNTLEIPLEIKLDARGVERHHDFSHLRTWTSIICRIEFVKTFPSFMKMTFITPKATDSSAREMLVLRINIPGLLVQLATSRTKKYSYGLFWKANRGKRCCAFLAFATQFDFEQHIQWIKYWIKYLEYYRKDFLLNRRDCTMNSTVQDSRNESLVSNINNTQNVKDIKEILGPLPKIPDSLNESWVRRQSCVSGIYEEIGSGRRNEGRSRDSSVSGVYEDVEFDQNSKDDVKGDNFLANLVEKNRPRVNTNDFVGVNRSQTNTEAELKHKKWWTLRGITKRFDGNAKNETGEVNRRRHFKSTFQKSNRNSFSTPDLSQLPDIFINCQRGDMNLSHTDSIDFLNISFESIADDLEHLTMQEKPPATNMLCTNSSSVNFLSTTGCSISVHEKTIEDEPIYQVPKNIPVRLIDETTGYCIMGPPMHRSVNDFPPFKSPEKALPDTTYLKMDEVRVELRKKVPPEEPIYANIERRPRTSLHRCSVEEKIPSYFPNEHVYQKPKMKPHTHIKKCQSMNVKPSNIYSPTPRKSQKTQRKTREDHLNNSYENAMLNQIDLEAATGTPKDKFGTLPHHPTSFKPLDAKNHFGSLPRFKKIDFSPLRVKLNNMFLRYNNNNNNNSKI
ncbi:uncharacterized protein LOC134830879 [Culicoides brevitarsis]|uniref:uncharacterized protein LOC134830879 n=1 Tax=Culicoides brevitarsis TaxID=469753 RepID=UPI00307C1F03